MKREISLYLATAVVFLVIGGFLMLLLVGKVANIIVRTRLQSPPEPQGQTPHRRRRNNYWISALLLALLVLMLAFFKPREEVLRYVKWLAAVLF